MSTLNCYRIDDGADHHVAATSRPEALRVLVGLEMLNKDAPCVVIRRIDDDKVPDFKIEQSEDADKPEGYTLREALTKARAEGKAQLLCSSEF